ncbi:MAG: hypothetical protein PIR02_16890 [Microbacterium enclense]
MSRTPDPSIDDTAGAVPRRLLFTTAAAGVATVVGVAAASPAAAAPGTTSWLLGGNTGVSTDGSNFLGPTNAGAPLIFKTRQSGQAAASERLRITATGSVGIGTATPAAKLEVVTAGVAFAGTTTSTSVSSTAVKASAKNGVAVRATATTGNGVDSTSTGGIAVRGTSKYIGVSGEGDSYGVFATSKSYGVISSGDDVGGQFTGAIGAYGISTSDSGVLGRGPIGVRAEGPTGLSAAATTSGQGIAVLGIAGEYSLYGNNAATAGVRVDCDYVGAWGTGGSYGMFAQARGTSGTNYGLYATTLSGDGYAVYAQGRVHVNGTLSKSAGSFLIDHPLDPENKWLSHSFVESPDMMNVYNGIVTTDADGNATVALPDYFDALNRDPRYQLTVIGEFAQAIVSRKVAENSFDIRTDRGNIEVSWQVTGIRQDAYAQAHPIQVEQDKTDDDKAASGNASRRSDGAADPRAPRASEVVLPQSAPVPDAPPLQ